MLRFLIRIDIDESTRNELLRWILLLTLILTPSSGLHYDVNNFGFVFLVQQAAAPAVRDYVRSLDIILTGVVARSG